MKILTVSVSISVGLAIAFSSFSSSTAIAKSPQSATISTEISQSKGRSRRTPRNQFTPPNTGRPVVSEGRDAYRTGGTPVPPLTPPPNYPAPRTTRSSGSR